MLRLIWKCAISLAALAILVGCRSQEGPDTMPVTGVVTQEGLPVAGAKVVFAPTAVGLQAASGTTDLEGRFELTTLRAGDGAVPGSYNVGISKTKGAEPEAAIPEGLSDEEATKRAAEKFYASKEALTATGKVKPKPAVELLPTIYKNPAKSGFKAEVIEGGDNHFEFNLKK